MELPYPHAAKIRIVKADNGRGFVGTAVGEIVITPQIFVFVNMVARELNPVLVIHFGTARARKFVIVRKVAMREMGMRGAAGAEPTAMRPDRTV